MTDVKPAPQATPEGSIDAEETERVALAYFDALTRRDLETAVTLWKPGGRENVRGQVDTTAPEGVRAFLGGIFGSFPDFEFNVLETHGPGRPRRRALGGARDVHRHAVPGRRGDRRQALPRRRRRPDRSRRPDRREQRVRRRDDGRAPARSDAAGGLEGRGRHEGRLQLQDDGPRSGSAASSSRSPMASGCCAAASR